MTHEAGGGRGSREGRALQAQLALRVEEVDRALTSDAISAQLITSGSTAASSLPSEVLDIVMQTLLGEVKRLSYLRLRREHIFSNASLVSRAFLDSANRRVHGIHMQCMDAAKLVSACRRFSELRTLSVWGHLDVFGHHSRLRKFPAELFSLVQLTELDLMCHETLRPLNSAIGKLTNLVTLKLGDCGLLELPPSISDLKALEELSMYANHFRTLPSQFGGLTSLKKLSVHNCQLTSLPLEFGQLVHLETLEMFNNDLWALPDTMGLLTNLTKLNVHSNRLSDLPASMAGLPKLKDLNMAAQRPKLTQFPDTVLTLRMLECLGLHENNISSVPSEIAEFAALKSLYLSQNRLDSLPDSIVSLTALTKLYIGQNVKSTTTIMMSSPAIYRWALPIFYMSETDEENDYSDDDDDNW